MTLSETPDAHSYLAVFKLYGDDLNELYKEPSDEAYRLLFGQVMKLMAASSAYNLSLPKPFRKAALDYAAEEWRAVSFFENPDNRHFFLSDFYDYVLLTSKRSSSSL